MNYWSLKQRLTIVSSIILFIAFSIIYFATQSAYLIASKSRLQESMVAQVYALMGSVEDQQGSLFLPQSLRNERLENMSSGLVAYVLKSDGTILWQSQSSELFQNIPSIKNTYSMQRLLESDFSGRDFFWVGESIIWEHETYNKQKNIEKTYYFIVGEKQSMLTSAVNKFKNEILAWLSISGVVLLIVFAYALNFSLRPLKTAQEQIELVRLGKTKNVEGDFPEELIPLTSSINQLLDSEARQKNRFRDSLGNLAHSLKTPLAIMKGELELESTFNQSLQYKSEAYEQSDKSKNQDNKNEILKNQVNRINDIVRYQLNRSVISSGRTLVKTCAVEPEVVKIIDALKKVYSQKKINFLCRVEANTTFPGDAGDLLELVGNLAENASKWTKTQVVVSAKHKDENFCLYIDDDGQGIEKENREAILNRGKRLDQTTEGQGLGLSIVMDIVKNYRGEITIETSALGGALFRVVIPLDE
jgi:two-component system sensor histidine kinase PhoQ